jgi:hypothetical protein
MDDSTKKQHEALTGMIRTASLNNIRLTGSIFEMEPEAVSLAPSEWKHELSAGVTECISRPEHRTLFGACGFRVVSQTGGGEQILAISATYLVSYQIDGEHGMPVFRQFLEEVGKPTIYPYFHALSAALTAQAGILLGPLPTIGVGPLALER